MQHRILYKWMLGNCSMNEWIKGDDLEEDDLDLLWPLPGIPGKFCWWGCDLCLLIHKAPGGGERGEELTVDTEALSWLYKTPCLVTAQRRSSPDRRPWGEYSQLLTSINKHQHSWGSFSPWGNTLPTHVLLLKADKSLKCNVASESQRCIIYVFFQPTQPISTPWELPVSWGVGQALLSSKLEAHSASCTCVSPTQWAQMLEGAWGASPHKEEARSTCWGPKSSIKVAWLPLCSPSTWTWTLTCDMEVPLLPWEPWYELKESQT